MGEKPAAPSIGPPIATLSHPLPLTFSIPNLRVLDGHPLPKLPPPQHQVIRLVPLLLPHTKLNHIGRPLFYLSHPWISSLPREKKICYKIYSVPPPQPSLRSPTSLPLRHKLYTSAHPVWKQHLQTPRCLSRPGSRGLCCPDPGLSAGTDS